VKTVSIAWLKSAALLLALLCMTSSLQAADKPNVAGNWTWTTKNRSGDEVKNTLKLKVDGDKITGTISGANNSEIEIKDAKLKDNELTFDVVRERNGNEFKTSYTGKVEGDTITGKIKRPGRNGGEGRSTDWKATREKAAA
jgi:hypothetical protein